MKPRKWHITLKEPEIKKKPSRAKAGPYKQASKFDQEIPQSQTADIPEAP